MKFSMENNRDINYIRQTIYGIRSYNRIMDSTYKVDLDTISLKMSELNLKHKQYSTEKYSCKRILFLIDSDFIGNSSGIYTFMKHIIRMFNKIGYVVDIISEIPIYEKIDSDTINRDITLSFPKYDDDTYIGDMYNVNSMLIDGSIMPSFFKKEIDLYLSKHSPQLVIANSLSTTKALIGSAVEDISISYTHIGDLMDESKVSMYDFTEESVVEYLSVLNNSTIQIGTQSQGSKNRMLEVLPKRKYDSISVLFEPYISNTEIVDYYENKKGIIIISGNYKRKAYDKMLEIAGKCKVPVTIVCGNVDHGYFNIRELVYKNKIKEFRILNDYHNDMVPQLIKGHRMMLQLADIEVFPYSVVESIFHIPCIINGKSKWGQEFLEEAIKIDPDNYSIDCIKKVYDNFDTYKKLNYQEYYSDTKQSWLNYMEELINN